MKIPRIPRVPRVNNIAPNIAPNIVPKIDLIDDNVVESDHHVLIIDKKSAEMIPLYDEDDEILEGLFESVPEYTTYKLYVGDFMETGKGVHRIINKLQSALIDDVLELHISSDGGDFWEVIQLHNLVDSMYSKRCTTYLNFGNSGGALAFVMGNNRIIYKHSTAMFHFFSGFESGKGSDMLKSLMHNTKMLGNYYRDELSDYFTKNELDLMINKGDEYWCDSIEMMNRKIATGIIIEGQYYSSKEYFEKYNKKGTIKKSYIKKMNKTEKKSNSGDNNEISIKLHT